MRQVFVDLRRRRILAGPGRRTGPARAITSARSLRSVAPSAACLLGYDDSAGHVGCRAGGEPSAPEIRAAERALGSSQGERAGGRPRIPGGRAAPDATSVSVGVPRHPRAACLCRTDAHLLPYRGRPAAAAVKASVGLRLRGDRLSRPAAAASRAHEHRILRPPGRSRPGQAGRSQCGHPKPRAVSPGIPGPGADTDRRKRPGRGTPRAHPAEYLAAALRKDAAKGIGPGAEVDVRLYFDTSRVRATGYRLYLFFP